LDIKKKHIDRFRVQKLNGCRRVYRATNNLDSGNAESSRVSRFKASISSSTKYVVKFTEVMSLKPPDKPRWASES